jgi:hypothetical protein
MQTKTPFEHLLKALSKKGQGWPRYAFYLFIFCEASAQFPQIANSLGLAHSTKQWIWSAIELEWMLHPFCS